MNVSPVIAMVVSAKLATLHELDTVYGPSDLYDMIEIVAVDSANQRIANTAVD